MKRFFSLLLIGFFFISSGCEKKDESIKPPSPISSNSTIPTKDDLPPAIGEGIIRGKVSFLGEPPAPQKMDLGADPSCLAAQEGNPLYSEDLMLNADKTIRGAFVYIVNPPAGKYLVPAETLKLDQKGCRYVPHILGIRVGQKLEIKNSDSTLHNVHGIVSNGKDFNIGMPVPGMKSERIFNREEVMIKLKCDVHPWMSAYIGVVDHPFFAVTGDDGLFEFKGLVPGTYKVAIWQEKLGVQQFEVEVFDKKVSEVNTSYAMIPK